MMKAEAGATCAVTGISSAMVSAGPIPGSTPTAVPSAQPISAQNRFIGCSATANPPISWLRTSMASPNQRQEGTKADAEAGEAEPCDAAEHLLTIGPTGLVMRGR